MSGLRSYQGQVIWITGASSGIGEALAYALSEAGATLILSARRADELERVRGACTSSDRHLVLPFDVSDAAEVFNAVDQARAWTPRLDRVVLNAGISQRSLIKETSLEVDERIMRVNYLGVIAHAKALLPWFTELGSGHYVVVTSLVGKFATPLRSAYAASKHALHGFFEAMRAEHASDQIDVTLICPGYIKTQISVNALIGDGSAQGVMDQAQDRGMSAEVFAERAARSIAKRRAEVYIGGRETWGVLVHRLAPCLFRALIKRVKVT